MKKIGFIDLYLDEWHANNYPDWIRGNAVAKKRNCDVAYAWAEMDHPGGMNTLEWCEKYQVQPLDSIERVVEKSDYLIILSPDHPEHHERLGRIPLMSGKPVYMDKTFSPDLDSGKRMFELADKYNTPLFSSSALRFAKELSGFPNDTVNREILEFIATSGPGLYENYSVHQYEIIVSMMGVGAQRIKSLSSDHGKVLMIDYENGRQAMLSQMQHAPFQVNLQMNNGNGIWIPECTDMFTRLIDSVIDFFESGIPPVPKEETLEIMALIDAGRKALNQRDTWVEVEQVMQAKI